MTPVRKVYDAFLAKMLEDEWANWTEEEVEEDWMTILQGAVAWFKFPRNSTEIVRDERYGDFFEGELTNDEIQILANRMKCEWLNRCIMTWDNVKTLYEERDFSQANMLDKLNQTLEREERKAAKLEAKYYRSIDRKPFDYRVLAGGQNG